MSKKTTKAPSGLSISRKGAKYTFKWSKEEKYEKIQLLYEYTIITKGKNKSTIAQALSDIKNLAGGRSSYVATVNKNNLARVLFRVRAKADKKSWSAWVPATFEVKLPNDVKLKADWNSETPNKTTFSFTATDEEHRPYDKIKYQKLWVKNCPRNASGLNWPATASENSNKHGVIFNSVENDYLNGSHARVIRAKAHGQAGWQKDWTYIRHVYAQPNAAANLSGSAIINTARSTIAVKLSWDLKVSAQRPCDKQTVQWLIDKPGENMVPPATGWQDDETPVHEKKTTRNGDETLGTNNWAGTLSQIVGENQCLWFRIKTKHDNRENFSEPVRVLTGALAKPSNVSVTPFESTYTYQVSANNNASEIPGSYLAIVANTPTGNVNLGIIPHGSSGPITINAPKWPEGDPYDIGVKAVVGTYTQKTVTEGENTYTTYIVKELMSSDITWQATHKAPSIDLIPADIEGTATVTWDFPWDEATQAEVSWADHIDAWNSTDKPTEFMVDNPAEGKLNISGLEPGVTYYVRVRLVRVEGDNTTYGAYSQTRTINLAAAPAIPTLYLSENMITPTDTVEASWIYVSRDGSAQRNALLALYDEDTDTYTPIEPLAGAEQTYTLDASVLGTGSHAIRVKVFSERGLESPWSRSAYLTISEPLSCTISETSLEMQSIETNPQDYSGEMVTFEGGDADNIKEVAALSVDLEPVQDLNGYDKPWAAGAGKNKFGGEFNVRFNLHIPAGTAFTASAKHVEGSVRIDYFDSDGNRIDWYGLTSGSERDYRTITSSVDIYSVLFAGTESSDYMIELGSTATSWTPYENICPISGHDSVDVHRTGVNIWDEVTENGYWDKDNGVFVSSPSSNWRAAKNYIHCTPNTSYYFKATIPTTGSFGAIVFYDKDKKFISSISNSTSAVNKAFTTPTNAWFMTFYVNVNWLNDGISINYPSTDTDYHAYTGTTYTVPLSETVYGGTLDLVSGEGESTYGFITVGELPWYYEPNYGGFFYSAALTNSLYKNTNANAQEVYKCSAYSLTSLTGVLPDSNMTRAPEGSVTYHYSGSNAYVYIKDNRFSTAEEFKAAMSDVQLAYKLQEPTDLQTTPQEVTLVEGVNNMWSEQGDINARIVDSYEEVLALTELPLHITVVGAGTENETAVKIVRRENFAQARPDETNLTGYEGEVIVQKVQQGDDEMTVTLEDLGKRYLDDGAKYKIVAWVQNDMRQSEVAELDFTVLWKHQAQSMENNAAVTIADGAAYITFTKPEGAIDTDTIDVYRLSADRPQLIYKGAKFTDTVVDPYPTINDFGGYRIVLVTANGDYTVDSTGSNFSWTDIEAGIDSLFQYIDFDGQELPVKFNVELDGQYSHISTVTHYLGGHIQGDSVVGTEMHGSIRAVLPYDIDLADYNTLCNLRDHTGLCHVRTKLGSNYTALIQVSIGLAYNSPGHPVKVTLTIDRVDNPNEDGVLIQDWEE